MTHIAINTTSTTSTTGRNNYVLDIKKQTKRNTLEETRIKVKIQIVRKKRKKLLFMHRICF